MHLTDVFISLLWALIILAIILRSQRFAGSGLRAALITSLFSAKLLATFCLQWLYTFYYTDRSTADIYRFFDDGVILSQVARIEPMQYLRILIGAYDPQGPFRTQYFERMNAWIKPFDEGIYNDNIFMIKLNSIFNFLSQNAYETNAVLFTGLAFVGMIWLVKALVPKSHAAQAMIMAVLFPSSLLWCSGGLKESVLIFAMGTIVLGVNRCLNNDFRPATIALIIIGVFFGIQIKPYVLALLSLGLASMFIGRKLNLKYASIWSFLTLLFIGAIAAHSYGYDIPALISNRQANFLAHSSAIQPGSFVGLPVIEPTWVSVLTHSPVALVQALTQPWSPALLKSPSLLMVIENLLMLLIAARACQNWWMRRRSLIQPLTNEWNSLLFATLVAIPGIVLIGLTSPVLGATMRYRVPFILLLLITSVPYLKLNLGIKPST